MSAGRTDCVNGRALAHQHDRDAIRMPGERNIFRQVGHVDSRGKSGPVSLGEFAILSLQFYQHEGSRNVVREHC